MKAVTAALLLLTLVLVLLPTRAEAHVFAPGLLELRELSAHRVQVGWRVPRAAAGSEPFTGEPVLEGCEAGSGVWRDEPSARVLSFEARCPRGISNVEIEAPAPETIVVRHQRQGGSVRVRVLEDMRSWKPQAEPGTRSFTQYVGLGAEHIATGYDHLLFVLGLLVLLYRHWRRLLTAVTAFTLAHSITLALAALDVLRLNPAAVEACIAISLVLLAREALRNQEPQTPRLAFGFGLLHGLGFASALRELGFGQGKDGLVMPLLGFNLGVELGQLAFIAVLLGLAWLGQRWRPLRAQPVRPVFSYVVGIAGAVWTLERLLGLSV